MKGLSHQMPSLEKREKKKMKKRAKESALQLLSLYRYNFMHALLLAISMAFQ